MAVRPKTDVGMKKVSHYPTENGSCPDKKSTCPERNKLPGKKEDFRVISEGDKSYLWL